MLVLTLTAVLTVLGAGATAQAAAAPPPAPSSTIALDATTTRFTAVDVSRRSLYVVQSSPRGDELAVVDTDLDRVRRTIPLDFAAGDLAVDPDTHRVYLARLSRGVDDPGPGPGLVELDPDTGSTRSTGLGLDRYAVPASIAVDPVHRTVLVGVGSPEQVLLAVDTTTLTETGRLGLGAGFVTVDLDPEARTAVVVVADIFRSLPDVLLVDTDSLTVVGRLDPPPGTNLVASVAIDTARHRAHVVSYAGYLFTPQPPESGAVRTLTTVDITTREVVQTLRPVPLLVGAAADPTTGLLHGVRTIRFDGGPSTIATVDPATGQVTREVLAPPTTPSGGAVEVDPATGTTFVAGSTEPDPVTGRSTAVLAVDSPAPSCDGVIGLIGEKFRQLGGCDGPLGAPTSGEQDAVGGKVTHFRNGDVYFSPATGAHAVLGAIATRYRALGAETSRLGYPTTDELDVLIGRASVFQHGFVFWNPFVGAVPVVF
ncbi:hypothetical protein GCM10027047_30000 [Rhodococcus aerolatus]